MPVMAINMLMANMIQLINENLTSHARTDAEVAVRDALAKIILRLKNPANYDGQAGYNLYEGILEAEATCYKEGLGLTRSFNLTVAREDILVDIRASTDQDGLLAADLAHLFRDRFSKDKVMSRPSVVHRQWLTESLLLLACPANM